MYGFKVVFFALFALLAVSASAAVTGKFNIVSSYKATKTGKDGKVEQIQQRNPMGYEDKNLANDKVLAAFVRDFGTWSNGEYKVTKARVGSIYNVQATRVYNNKNDSNDANNRAKRIITQHRSSQ